MINSWTPGAFNSLKRILIKRIGLVYDEMNGKMNAIPFS